MNNIQTSTFGFYQMELSEIKELEVGDEVAICTYMNLPKTVSFTKATVVRPLFWNSDADEPDWEIETNNGFIDTHSIYGITSTRPF